MHFVRLRTLCTLLLALTAFPALRAQLILARHAETVPAFEVSTVKPSSRDLGRSFHASVRWSSSSYSAENMTLRNLIRNAFDAQSPPQLSGGPDALLDARWDISAKMGEDDYARLKKLSRDARFRTLHLMVQALLADRFGLKVHVEARVLPVFDLVVGKGGPKLKPSVLESPNTVAPAPGGAGGPAPNRPAMPSQGVSTDVDNDQGTMTATDETIDALTTMLSRQAELDGRIVIDKTGLTGKYDWTLHWSPQRFDAAASADATGPSLFSALKDQLGLKLEPAKGPVEIVVVDAVSNPTPN